MRVTRVFVGWDRPVAEAVADVLLPDPTATVDLHDCRVIVPTRQAGRRLRETLARRLAPHGRGLLPPDTRTPGGLLAAEPGAEVADALVEEAVWCERLLRLNLSHYPALFPHAPPAQDAVWAIDMARLLSGLRATLSDAGCDLAAVAARADVQEPERWSDLARLETAYRADLHRLRLEDPHDARVRRAGDPALWEGLRRVVVACTPDPAPLLLRALEQAAARVDVQVLIHAPETEAATFDDWGRPLAAAWADSAREIPIPDPDRTLHLAANPREQALAVTLEIGRLAGIHAPGDFAVGVPDREIVEPLRRELETCGLGIHDPAEPPLRDHPLHALLAAYADLVSTPTFRAVRTLLRHPDVLDWLARTHGVDATGLLTALDTAQGEALPEDLAALLGTAPPDAAATGLAPALAALKRWRGEFTDGASNGRAGEAVLSFLRQIHADRMLSPGNAQDERFRVAARLILDALLDLDRAPLQGLSLAPPVRLGLAVRAIERQPVPAAQGGAAIELQGWLELVWNPAPVLLVTGLNEGHVPDSRVADAFLPDSLRARLDLRDDRRLLARDAFLLRTLLEQRRERGTLRLLCGKRSAGGDPLRPSRLLLRCPAAELPARAQRLFGDAPDTRLPLPRSIPFALDPRALDLTRLQPPERIRVTALRDYLACPFRFFLSQVLRMEALDDRKEEPDALDFGTLVHAALERMRQEGAADCPDANRLGGMLAAWAAEAWRARFGAHASLAVRAALDAAQRRLRAVAGLQVELAAGGWEIVDTEVVVALPVGGCSVTGRIDRIDRNRHTGRYRVLDYKTTDSAALPADTHLAAFRDDDPDYVACPVAAGRPRRWRDLQLPLYRAQAAALLNVPQADIDVGYVLLPRAVRSTALALWDDLSEAQTTSARATATEAVRRIRAGIFWPPAARAPSRDDPFAALLPADPALCIAAGGLDGLWTEGAP